MPSNQRVEPVILLLTGLVVFFSLMLVGIAIWLKTDGQTFQVISGLVTGFSGALLMRVKPRGSAADDPPPPGSLQRTSMTQDMHTETVVPPVPPAPPAAG